MKNRGFTLTELLIVIALIGILLAIAVPNYRDSITKARIEKQTKELHSLIVNARLTAMQTKQPRAIYLGPQQGVFSIYTSLDFNLLGSTTGFKSVKTTFFPFVIKKRTTGAPTTDLDVTSDRIRFDTRGFTNDDMTLFVTPTMYSGGDDCIIVHTSRTNIGRMENASTCTTH